MNCCVLFRLDFNAIVLTKKIINFVLKMKCQLFLTKQKLCCVDDFITSIFICSMAQTPIFQSPRLPVKRKVSVDEPDSPNSKHRKAALESSFTPKVMRARSVSIKNRFKRKKSLDGSKFKEPTLIIHHPFDANALSKTPGLPNKPNFAQLTKTPSELQLI